MILCDIASVKLKQLRTDNKNTDRQRSRQSVFLCLRSGNCRCRSIGQSFSAFCTSSFQNISAVGSSHSLSETMLFLSLTFFGLVSSEHFGTSFNDRSEAFVHTLLHNATYIINDFYPICQEFFKKNNFSARKFLFFLTIPLFSCIMEEKEG